MISYKLRAPLALFVVAALTACGGGDRGEEAASQTPGASSSQAAAPVDLSNAGGVKGVVHYAGSDPDKPIDMNSDPACAGLNPKPVDAGAVVANGGNLANVFVYVKSGLEGKSFPVPPEKKVLNQQACTYHPRILGVRVGQPLTIKNSDPALHNVHGLPKTNEGFNQAQPIQGMEFDKTFDKPEVMVHVKCDVHPWMSAYIGVVAHPYFAVTGQDGSFDIPKLPPGTYTLEAWHEALGTQTKQVTVAPNQTVDVTFDFPAAAAPASAPAS
jgi:plastocyanin